MLFFSLASGLSYPGEQLLQLPFHKINFVFVPPRKLKGVSFLFSFAPGFTFSEFVHFLLDYFTR